MTHIKEPDKIPWLMKLGIYIAEKKTGKIMKPARILSWYPKAALGSGVLESLVAHEEEGISKRLLQLIRMQVSILVNCSFCIDLNSTEFRKNGIVPEEVEALQGIRQLEEISSFSPEERIALRYAKELTETPVVVSEGSVEAMKQAFDEKQFVVIVTTIAQVNYWARLIKGFGIPPAGLLEECRIK